MTRFAVHGVALPLFLILFSLFTSEPLWGANSKNVPSLCKISHPSDADVEWECRRLRKGETLERLFGDRWKDVARFNRIDRRHAYPGNFLKIPKHLDDIVDFTPMPREYPSTASEAKFILVDLSEQFLGAYAFGRLVFSSPIATGEKSNETPTGDFRITATSRSHRSSLYMIENTEIPYPMNYALRFYINKEGVAFWIHGRDLPGYPASHGCIGLTDESMQKKFYHVPKDPFLEDARTLYEWVQGSPPDSEGFQIVKDGPRVLVIGHAPGTM